MHVVETLSAWSRALRDQSLRDLPYKIETNEYGQLVMSPQKPHHGRMQSRIDVLLSAHVDRPGECAVEFAVETAKGVKVPDVVWISEERLQRVPADIEASPIAPEICIEVLSTSNIRAEIDEKRRLYFEYGALEVWTCDIEGRLRFFTVAGERPNSEMVPSFPRTIAGRAPSK
jgi:Uma2 family endonuclease